MKPGYLTSEFFLSLALVVCATVLAVVDNISSTEWTAATTAATGFYTLSRGLAKVNPPKRPRVRKVTGEPSVD